jgi:hypothetical protein
MGARNLNYYERTSHSSRLTRANHTAFDLRRSICRICAKPLQCVSLGSSLFALRSSLFPCPHPLLAAFRKLGADGRGLKWTATACGVRRTTFALRRKPSASMKSTNCSGMPTGLVTRSNAPVSEIFRTVQSIKDLPPLKTILPAFKTRRRRDFRFSSIRDAIRLPAELQPRDRGARSVARCQHAIRVASPRGRLRATDDSATRALAATDACAT